MRPLQLSSEEAQNETMSLAVRTRTSRLCSGSTMSHYRTPGFPAKLPNPRLGEAHGKPGLDSRSAQTTRATSGTLGTQRRDAMSQRGNSPSFKKDKKCRGQNSQKHLNP